MPESDNVCVSVAPGIFVSRYASKFIVIDCSVYATHICVSVSTDAASVYLQIVNLHYAMLNYYYYLKVLLLHTQMPLLNEFQFKIKHLCVSVMWLRGSDFSQRLMHQTFFEHH